jgi:hypothetical protein
LDTQQAHSCAWIREESSSVSERYFIVTLAVTLPEDTDVSTPDTWNFNGLVNPKGTPDTKITPVKTIHVIEYPIPKEKQH